MLIPELGPIPMNLRGYPLKVVSPDLVLRKHRESLGIMDKNGTEPFDRTSGKMTLIT